MKIYNFGGDYQYQNELKSQVIKKEEEHVEDKIQERGGEIAESNAQHKEDKQEASKKKKENRS